MEYHVSGDEAEHQPRQAAQDRNHNDPLHGNPLASERPHLHLDPVDLDLLVGARHALLGARLHPSPSAILQADRPRLSLRQSCASLLRPKGRVTMRRASAISVIAASMVFTLLPVKAAWADIAVAQSDTDTYTRCELPHQRCYRWCKRTFENSDNSQWWKCQNGCDAGYRRCSKGHDFYLTWRGSVLRFNRD